MSLITRVQDALVRVGTEFKTHAGKIGDLSTLSTTAKTSLVAALNELDAELTSIASAGGATINDASTASTTQTYSITKIRDLVTTALNDLKAGAPAALDTIDELAAALNDDANAIGAITTALASRVRTDTAAQGLTTQQKTNARTNIDAVGTTDIGDPETNLVNVFTAALV